MPNARRQRAAKKRAKAKIHATAGPARSHTATATTTTTTAPASAAAASTLSKRGSSTRANKRPKRDAEKHHDGRTRPPLTRQQSRARRHPSDASPPGSAVANCPHIKRYGRSGLSAMLVACMLCLVPHIMDSLSASPTTICCSLMAAHESVHPCLLEHSCPIPQHTACHSVSKDDRGYPQPAQLDVWSVS